MLVPFLLLCPVNNLGKLLVIFNTCHNHHSSLSLAMDGVGRLSSEAGSVEQGAFLVTRWAKMENLTGKWPKVRMPTIFAPYPCYSLRPVGTTSELLHAVKNHLRWTVIVLVLGKRIKVLNF